MYQLNRNIVIAAALLASAALTACGGGSSGSGGGSGSAESSSIVVDLSSNTAMFQGPLEELDATTRFAILIRDLAIRNAWAQTAGVPIYFNGDLVGETGSDGGFVKAVPAGTYTVCIGDLSTCIEPPITVGINQVIVISNVNVDASGALTYDEPMKESAFNYLEEFESDKSHKVYWCHKGKTINVAKSSVGTEYSSKGHKAHGDIAGRCASDAAATGNVNPGNSDKDNKGNNGKGNDNRCNKGNKPKKGCPVNEPV